MKIKSILVSQPKPESDKSPYFDLAAKYGVDIVFRPFIKVEGLTAKEFRTQKINLADYTAVILTSRHAVDNFFRMCEETRVSVPDTMRYFCTTQSTANYLQKYIVYRKRKIFFGTSGRLDDPALIQAFRKHAKEKFIFPINDVPGADAPEETLDSLKIDYTKAPMFRTVSNDFTPDEPFDYDMLVFFSPIGIDALLKNFPDFKETKPEVRIACLGVSTAAAVKKAGLRLDVEAPSPRFPSMTAAIGAYLQEQDA